MLSKNEHSGEPLPVNHFKWFPLSDVEKISKVLIKTRISIPDLLSAQESWSPIWASEPISIKWRLQKTGPVLGSSDQLFLLLTSSSCSSITLNPAFPKAILRQIIVSEHFLELLSAQWCSAVSHPCRSGFLHSGTVDTLD